MYFSVLVNILWLRYWSTTPWPNSLQSLSRVQLFVTPWTAAHQASQSVINSQSLLKLMSIKSVMLSTISSSVIPFSSYLQSFPASGSFPISPFYASGGQSIGASASVLPMNIQDWFALGLTGLISLQSKGLSRVFSKTTVRKHQFFSTQPSLSNSHIHTWLWLDGRCPVCHSFSSKEQVSFNFMAAVTIHSDSGAQENKAM